MMLQDIPLPSGGGNMRVYLCRSYVFMTQHLLDHTQVCPILNQVSSKRMPE